MCVKAVCFISKLKSLHPCVTSSSRFIYMRAIKVSNFFVCLFNAHGVLLLRPFADLVSKNYEPDKKIKKKKSKMFMEAETVQVIIHKWRKHRNKVSKKYK